MVFDKQHLRLFVALACLIVYANATPTALTNENNVERLRGDLHQFIEMIINCLSNTKIPNHTSVDPTQIQHFKQITNSLQEDVGIPMEVKTVENSNGNGDSRKFVTSQNHHAHGGEFEKNSSEEPNENENSSEKNEASINNSKELMETSDSKENSSEGGVVHSTEEAANRREFDLQEGNGHDFTPRPTSTDASDLLNMDKSATMSTTSASTNQPQDSSDIGLRILPSDSKEDTTDESQNQQTSSETRTTSGENTSTENISFTSKEEDTSVSHDVHEPTIEEKVKAKLGKILQNMSNSSKQYKPKHTGRKSISDESSSSNSNESKDKSENNTEEIQVRNLIKETPKFASDSSVHPYDALHIYGIQTNGPINKIVFEGGEHHPPRPLTIKESNHLKEFIRMVLSTNKLHSPMATFPIEEEISPRSGFNGGNIKKSPWADKPVPLELV